MLWMRTAACNQLKRQNINPTKVTESKGGIELSFMKPKVTTRDLVIFTRQFATMIDSGLPLVQCLTFKVNRQRMKRFAVSCL